MKRYFYLILLFPFMLQAQSVQKGESAIVYSLPKTEFLIHVTTEIVTEKPGKFFQYSDRYLATKNVITAEKKYYKIKSIELEQQTVPDATRTYTITPSKKTIATQITVNNEGLLCGINVDPVASNPKPVVKSESREEVVIPDKLLPLNEEYMMAGSIAKMAEGASRQIYRLRENKGEILAGEVEFMPKDGASLKTMIAEIDAQEKELTELFTGTTSISTSSKTIRYVPTKAVEDDVVFRFTASKGIVDGDDLSGEPVYLSLSFTPVKVASNPNLKVKKDEVQVFTIIPVTANVSIDNGDRNLLEQSLIVPQLGELVPIPLKTMDRYCKAQVSIETGRLLSIEQLKKK